MSLPRFEVFPFGVLEASLFPLFGADCRIETVFPSETALSFACALLSVAWFPTSPYSSCPSPLLKLSRYCVWIPCTPIYTMYPTCTPMLWCVWIPPQSGQPAPATGALIRSELVERFLFPWGKSFRTHLSIVGLKFEVPSSSSFLSNPGIWLPRCLPYLRGVPPSTTQRGARWRISNPTRD